MGVEIFFGNFSLESWFGCHSSEEREAGKRWKFLGAQVTPFWRVDSADVKNIALIQVVNLVRDIFCFAIGWICFSFFFSRGWKGLQWFGRGSWKVLPAKVVLIESKDLYLQGGSVDSLKNFFFLASFDTAFVTCEILFYWN